MDWAFAALIGLPKHIMSRAVQINQSGQSLRSTSTWNDAQTNLGNPICALWVHNPHPTRQRNFGAPPKAIRLSRRSTEQSFDQSRPIHLASVVQSDHHQIPWHLRPPQMRDPNLIQSHVLG